MAWIVSKKPAFRSHPSPEPGVVNGKKAGPAFWWTLEVGGRVRTVGLRARIELN